MLSPARAAAFEILRLVERGGYAGDLLHARTAAIDSRDAGLAEEIVLGTLRFQAQIDFLIAKFAARPVGKLDAEVRIALRMGVYQIRFLDRVPAHAAVSESVELVKQARKKSAAGFVNAVLRKTPRGPVEWPDRATALSHPAWLLESWTSQFGEETAMRIAAANLRTPETWVRLPAGAPLPQGLELEPAAAPGAYRVLTGNPAGLRVQDIGAQAIVPLLELEPGQTFLDVCAAPGNKTAQALEAGVEAVACDVHLSRLRALSSLACRRVALDAEQPLPFSRSFDRILVDAPCSGSGTLARNPEIKWRLTPADIADLHGRQVRILTNALQRLAPSGRLVYSTCSLEREENEAVVDEVASRTPSMRKRFWRRLPGLEPGDGFFAAVLTSD